MVFFKAESILKERQRHQMGRMLSKELRKVGWELGGCRRPPRSCSTWNGEGDVSCPDGQHKGDTCQSCLLFLVWFQLSRLMIAKRNINKSLQPVHSGFVQCFSSSSAVYVNNTAHVLRKTLIHHSLQKMHMEKRQLPIFALKCQQNDPHGKHGKPALTATACSQQ